MSDLTPGSEAWAKRVTASKVAAILGLSPFSSPRATWHLMHGDVPNRDGNDTTRRGQFLEAGVLAWFRHKHGITDDRQWTDQPSYVLGGWAAATPDAMTLGLPDVAEVLIDAKTTSDFEWAEVPVHYYAQALWAMRVSGIHQFRFAVLHGGLRFEEYVVEYDAALADDVEAKCRAFYDSLAAGTPPPLDDTVATWEAVRKVHPDIEAKTEVELTAEQADDLVTFKHLADESERSLRLAKSTVIDLMGRAQYATHNGQRIARRQGGKHGVTFVVVAKPADLNPDMEQTA